MWRHAYDLFRTKLQLFSFNIY